MRTPTFSEAWRFAVLCFAVASSWANADQVAAAVEYQFVARPSALPEDLQPAQDTSLRFLSIKAIDGFRIDASLWLLLLSDWLQLAASSASH
jgi:hypothetical protein